MKIWAVVGVNEIWEDECIPYGVYATEELAAQGLKEVNKDDPEHLWLIEEWEVVDK